MYEDEAIKNKKDIVLDLSDTEATAKICKALSSETRLEILKCLVDKSMTISELAEAFICRCPRCACILRRSAKRT